MNRLIILALSATFALSIAGCADTSSESAANEAATAGDDAEADAAQASADAAAAAADAAVAAADAAMGGTSVTHWSYGQDEDPMGKGTTQFAHVRSSNTVTFDSPYDGPQQATLTLRTHPRHGKDVILSIERGQFLCPSYQDCNVLVRFDDQKASTYSGAGAADNSTETVFIRNYPRFVASMVKAKRVRISAEIYQEGAPVFEFDVTGFDEAKYKPKK